MGVSQTFCVEQRAPPIFGRVAITLDVGPHSSCLWDIVLTPLPLIFNMLYSSCGSWLSWRPVLVSLRDVTHVGYQCDSEWQSSMLSCLNSLAPQYLIGNCHLTTAMVAISSSHQTTSKFSDLKTCSRLGNHLFTGQSMSL